MYGGKPDGKDIDDAVLYVVTNDGSLHAIDVKSRVEQWSYIPQDSPRDVERPSQRCDDYAEALLGRRQHPGAQVRHEWRRRRSTPATTIA